MAQTERDERKIEQLIKQKLEHSARIRELKHDITKINLDLLKVGANTNELICW